ncbi:MAG: SAM-dependent methyltransferase [Glaciihabitans sp.]|nr:SAM-dependent methyltransferase [Glaciihabitans sp.]
MDPNVDASGNPQAPKPDAIVADARLIAALRADLLAAGFDVAGLGELWGEDAAAALHRAHRVPARRALDRVAGFSAAAVLARLFVLGLPVAGEDLATALPSLGVEGAVSLGLVAASTGLITPLVDLRPYSFTDSWGEANWWIASDLGELSLGRALNENHVLGVGGASLTLTGLMIDRSARTTLDLGTGCGIQAMHASRHSGRVIATDISERALDYARFNATLNGIANIEFRLGSLFEPVAGERFDHIVSNPPFVITPRAEGVPAYEYRDGGRVGDALVAEVVAGAATHLRQVGVAQLLGNWEYRATEDGLERVADWLDGTDLDAWIVEREVQDAPLYAETWIRDGGTRSGDEFDRLSGAWLDDFEAREVTSVGFGYLTLRKPASGAPTLRRLERLDGPVGNSLGQHIGATLAAYDWQASLDDYALSRAMLTVASDVTEERHYWPGDEHPAVMNLKQGGGFARSYPLDTVLAAVVGACDGELSIAAICGALAELLSVDQGDGADQDGADQDGVDQDDGADQDGAEPIDPDALLAETLPMIRELVTVGILRRPEPS